MQTSKLLGNRRKTYILDVICNIFYFGEVQEVVLGQYNGQSILAPKRKIYLSIRGLFQKKRQAEWLRKCLCKYSTDVSRFVLEILENRSSLQLWFHKSVWHPLKIPRPEKGISKLCGFFVDYPCKFQALSNSLQEILHTITSTLSHLHVFKPIAWVFHWNSLVQKDVWAMTSSEWKLYVAAKFLTNFKHLKGVSNSLLILDNSLLIRLQRKEE